MNIHSLFRSEFSEHERAIAASRTLLEEPFGRLVSACTECLKQDGKLLFFGNGGNAATAQHLATELTVRYRSDRIAIAAIALATDTSALTAVGNDFGFDFVFSRQIEALGRPGDVAIGISTSGKSQNVLLALEVARQRGLVAAAASGGDAGELKGRADPLLIVPSPITARIQEIHILLGHMLCKALEISLGLAEPIQLNPTDASHEMLPADRC